MRDNHEKISLISLGCAKNLVDSEYILGWLHGKGFSIVAEMEEADIAFINTCAFIQSAVEETIDTILWAISLKNRGHLKKLYVVGCFVQRYGYKLKKELPEVDGWAGTGEIEELLISFDSDIEQAIPFCLGKPGYLADSRSPRMRVSPYHSAYLKIAEGCSNRCTYCLIPALRGRFRSKHLGSVLEEAKQLVESGTTEINLIAQDTTLYGQDLEPKIELEGLIEKLLEIDQIQWIRLMYCHPNRVSNRLLDMMEKERRLCSYLDIPLQHVHDRILEAMGRPFNKEETPLKLINRIRERAPSVSIRTTFMVGFPGETDKIFNKLMEFIKLVEFENLGTFIFSPEKGTRAARLEGLPQASIAEERLKEIMELQATLSQNRNQRLVGKTLPVILDGFSDETDLLLSGRTAGMAPDVDGRVLINKGQGKIGEIKPVLINEVYAYDLIGEIIEHDIKI
jgi:ribosomal protein S12 methylthiotransferase